ncbi:MAG: class E sortase [Chloroflexi bacterium]|nr:class E sortase [Chloroflexota bacterium]
MRDKRPVDELSIEELERILAIKRRAARQEQIARMHRDGRLVGAGNGRGGAVPSDHELPVERPIQVYPQTPPPDSALTGPPVNVPAPVPESALIPAESRALTHDESGVPQFEEGDAYTETEFAPRPVNKKAQRKLIDRVLIFVEVAAVIGIVMIALNLVGAIGALERETAEAQALADAQRRAGQPTLAPTPELRMENYVLPGGHTSPTEPGGAQFNYAEVPEHLLPVVQSQWIAPVVSRPQVTNETALRLNIPALDNFNQTIVQGVDWNSLMQGVGQLPNDTHPGDPNGNVVLAAHNDIYGELFRDLDQLQPGDEFHIETATQLYSYRVTEIRVVEPHEVWVLEARGAATATLISCYPYQVNDQRIIVFADRIT